MCTRSSGHRACERSMMCREFEPRVSDARLGRAREAREQYMKTENGNVRSCGRWIGPGWFGAGGSAMAVSAVIGSMLLVGCVSYTNVPAPESAIAFKSANHGQSIKVIRTALGEIIARYPMRDGQGRYTVSLPMGTTLETARSVLEGLPEGGVVPYDGMDGSIPVYSVGRVWIRASDAKVDVIYPVKGYRGDQSVGNATVWLNGGVQPWRVARVQHWSPGTLVEHGLVVPLPKDYQPGSGEVFEQPTVDVETAPAPDVSDTPMIDEHVDPSAEDVKPESSEAEHEARGTGGMYRQVPIDD